jgi:hypothetical protein
MPEPTGAVGKHTVKDNGAVDGNEPRDVDTMVSKQCCDGH